MPEHDPKSDATNINSQALIRISNIEITNVGQANRIDRHPLTFANNGDMKGSYLKQSVIHRSFNRAVHIHLTNNLLFEANVVYDVKGAGFALQDGREIGNTMTHNLVVFVRSSPSSYNVDLTPAAFILSNPNNTLTHNTAVGCSHFGFWYRTLSNPEDQQAYGCPNKTPLGKFFNNTAHSIGSIGLWIFPGYYPMRGCYWYLDEPVPAVFEYFTAYSNDKAAEFLNSNYIQFRNFIVWDHFSTAINTKFSDLYWRNADYDEKTGSVVVDSVIIGCSSDDCLPENKANTRGLDLATDRGQLIRNVSFVNYPNSSAMYW